MPITERLDTPTMYEWQLNENSTRYDYPRSWPEEDTRQLQFSVLAAVNGFVAISCFIVIVAIIRSRMTRKNPFNLYVLFIAIPDFLSSFSCFWTCVLSAPIKKYFSEAMCGFQSFYLTFAFAANAWMNLFIVYQIHRLLRNNSANQPRYEPPTRTRVISEAAGVYTYALIWGVLAGFNFNGVPFETHLYYGFACLPMEVDLASTIFFYAVYIPGIILIPCFYALYVLIDIMRHKLLPNRGQRRKISIFLLRLIIIYFMIWMPFVLVAFIGNFFNLGSWGGWVAAIISHFQGLITVVVIYYTNDEIHKEIDNMLCCRWTNRLHLANSLDLYFQDRTNEEKVDDIIHHDGQPKYLMSVRDLLKNVVFRSKSSNPSNAAKEDRRTGNEDADHVAEHVVIEDTSIPLKGGDAATPEQHPISRRMQREYLSSITASNGDFDESGMSSSELVSPESRPWGGAESGATSSSPLAYFRRLREPSSLIMISEGSLPSRSVASAPAVKRVSFELPEETQKRRWSESERSQASPLNLEEFQKQDAQSGEKEATSGGELGESTIASLEEGLSLSSASFDRMNAFANDTDDLEAPLQPRRSMSPQSSESEEVIDDELIESCGNEQEKAMRV